MDLRILHQALMLFATSVSLRLVMGVTVGFATLSGHAGEPHSADMEEFSTISLGETRPSTSKRAAQDLAQWYSDAVNNATFPLATSFRDQVLHPMTGDTCDDGYSQCNVTSIIAILQPLHSPCLTNNSMVFHSHCFFSLPSGKDCKVMVVAPHGIKDRMPIQAVVISQKDLVDKNGNRRQSVQVGRWMASFTSDEESITWHQEEQKVYESTTD